MKGRLGMEIIKKYDTGYTQVLNKVLYDSELSLRAKGMYGYLFSKPDGWQFHIVTMQKELKESKGQIYAIIDELIKFGYIKRNQVNENGKFGGIVYEFINRDEKIPCSEKSAYGKTSILNNTYILSNTDNINISDKDLFGSKQESSTDFVSWEEQAPQSPQNPKPAKHKFKKPTRDEVILYAIQRGRTDLVDKFFDYYEAGDWTGVKNWKQKFITWEMHNEKPKQVKITTDNELRAKL